MNKRYGRPTWLAASPTPFCWYIRSNISRTMFFSSPSKRRNSLDL